MPTDSMGPVAAVCMQHSAAPQPPAGLICYCHLLNNCFSAVWPPRAAPLLRAALSAALILWFSWHLSQRSSGSLGAEL